MKYEASSAASDQMHRKLASGVGKGCCWLLIDPVLRPVLDDSPLDLALRGKTWISVPSSGDPDPRLMPQLVMLDSNVAQDSGAIQVSLLEARNELAPDILAQGGGRRICAWLECAAKGETLARHIANQLIQTHTKVRRRLLRWHDPAVFWGLWPTLTPLQQTKLLGPITRYWLLDPLGNHIEYESPLKTAISGALDLSGEQWQSVEHITALNGLLRKQLEPKSTVSDLATIRDRSMAAFARASLLGFHDQHDLVAFATYALKIDPAFDLHPLIAARLKTRMSDDFFTALVDDLTAEQWDLIREQGRNKTNRNSQEI